MSFPEPCLAWRPLPLLAAGLAFFLLQSAGAPRAGEPAKSKSVLRTPWGERRWHEKDPVRLRQQVQALFAAAAGDRIENAIALILPHAGYRFAGPTAAAAVGRISGASYERVIILAFSHRFARSMLNIASLPEWTHCATPLGEVPVDAELVERLRGCPLFRRLPQAHQDEHSAQILLPYLQVTLGDFRFLPVLVGSLDAESRRRMAGVLAGCIDNRTLVVASSDFTHYGADFGYVPFEDDIENRLRELDSGAWDLIAARDSQGFLDYCDRTGATICGRGPISLLAEMLPAQAKAQRLHYDASGRMSGDFTSSVSYLSAAFTGAWKEGEPVKADPKNDPLTAGDKQALLALARSTIRLTLEKRRPPSEAELGVRPSEGMQTVMGVFVTLHKQGRLRGCIGEIFPSRPLYQAVIAQAVNAAFNDHRFPQVQPAELDQLHLEISALTPPRPVASYNEIIIGRHGMVIKKHGRSAVYLPQVAPEQGWDLATTLGQLSLKAGLPQDAWREGAEYTVFEAIVFSEPEGGPGR